MPRRSAPHPNGEPILNVIETKDLSKRYRKQLAVDAISFQVERGQVFGFLGPNGSGPRATSKSTSVCGRSPSFSRISWGIVTWPFVVIFMSEQMRQGAFERDLTKHPLLNQNLSSDGGGVRLQPPRARGQ